MLSLISFALSFLIKKKFLHRLQSYFNCSIVDMSLVIIFLFSLFLLGKGMKCEILLETY